MNKTLSLRFQALVGVYILLRYPWILPQETALKWLLNALRINLMLHSAFDSWRLLLLG